MSDQQLGIIHIDVPQYSDEYWEARSGRADETVRIPASSAAAFTPEGHPFMTADQVVRSVVRAYHGAESEFSGNVATRWGTEHEEQCRNWYSLETDTVINECGIFLYGDLFGTSPDGLIGSNGVVEIKAPYSMREKSPSDFKMLSQQPHYEVQTTLEMVGTGRRFVEFIQWCPQGGVVEHKELDTNHWQYLRPYLVEGRDRILAELDNPEHLQPLVTEIHDPEFLDLASEYANKDRLLKANEAELKEIKAKLLALSFTIAEGKNVKGGGLTITSATRKGSIDYKKLLKDAEVELDAEQYRKKPTHYQTVRIGDA